jgi:hypothetical protein
MRFWGQPRSWLYTRHPFKHAVDGGKCQPQPQEVVLVQQSMQCHLNTLVGKQHSYGSHLKKWHLLVHLQSVHLLAITTMPIPTMNVCECDSVQSSEKTIVYISKWHGCYCKMSIVPLAAKFILHIWESKLDWVIIWRIWWQEFTLHTPGLAVSMNIRHSYTCTKHESILE